MVTHEKLHSVGDDDVKSNGEEDSLQQLDETGVDDVETIWCYRCSSSEDKDKDTAEGELSTGQQAFDEKMVDSLSVFNHRLVDEVSGDLLRRVGWRKRTLCRP